MILELPYVKNRRKWNPGALFIVLIASLTGLGFIRSTKIKRISPVFQQSYGMPLTYTGELHILTYNIAGLPEIISSAKTKRDSSIQHIGRKLNAFDIVNVQEDFHYNAFLYKENAHPYRSPSTGTVPFGDGLSTLSKYPIVKFERVAWQACNGADCLTPKGFTMARIQLAEAVFVDVYNVHATAQDDRNATKARQKNLKQLIKYIRKYSSGHALLLLGDFNAHYQNSNDNILDFQQQLRLHDSWIELQQTGVFPDKKDDFVALDALAVTDMTESIDKIFYRSTTELRFVPVAYKIENQLFTTPSGEPLSDHCAVSLRLTWQRF